MRVCEMYQITKYTLHQKNILPVHKQQTVSIPIPCQEIEYSLLTLTIPSDSLGFERNHQIIQKIEHHLEIRNVRIMEIVSNWNSPHNIQPKTEYKQLYE